MYSHRRCLLDSCQLLLTFWARLPQLLRPPVQRVLAKQLYFSGLESIGVALAMGIGMGIALVIEVHAFVGQNIELTGKLLAYVAIRELGPRLAAIVLIARSGSAMASELAAMQVNREISQLRAMGVPPLDYLLLPRLLGAAFSCLGLTFYLALGSIVSGSLMVLLTSTTSDFPPLLDFIQPMDIGICMLKSLVFGLWIAAVTCNFGLHAGRSMTEIPQAASRAVIHALITVFLLDGILTVLLSVGASDA
jgi:phospholipid/cholesterol/gamma-HCH transport system permease protein